MKLDLVSLDKLHPSKTNQRFSKKAPDVTDLVPSVREKGVVMPIVVRPEPDDAGNDGFGVVAGLRRYTAAMIVAQEVRAAGGEPDPIPCAIREDGEDVDAIEISIIENVQRRDPDEVTQWESFTRLVKEGRSIDEIATTFAMPELAVKRTLALGNLLPRIRTLYRAEEIDATTVRHLTLATKNQQKAWLALLDDEDAYVPSGHRLKEWLFGGQSIPTKHALFDIAEAKIATADFLFDDSSYFTDSEAFWGVQNAAIEQRREAYIEAGWADAVIVPPNTHFSTWEYEKTPKRRGGRVYIDVRTSGEVCFHEGYLTRKEAQRAAASEKGEGPGSGIKVPRPEVTSTMGIYIDLHRHAAVRAELATRPQVALRLMVAHAIAGTHLWRVEADPRRSQNDDVAESAASASAEAAFDGYRRAVLDLLGYPEDEENVVGRQGRAMGVPALFERLMNLPDGQVMDIVAVVMGETMASGSTSVELVGETLGTDMANWWQADDAFFGLIRDREVLGAIVAEVAGDLVAKANTAGCASRRVPTPNEAASPPGARRPRRRPGSGPAAKRKSWTARPTMRSSRSRTRPDRDGGGGAAPFSPWEPEISGRPPCRRSGGSARGRSRVPREDRRRSSRGAGIETRRIAKMRRVGLITPVNRDAPEHRLSPSMRCAAGEMDMDQHGDREGGGDPDGQARAILAMVRATERVEGTVAIGLMAICVGLPVIGGIVRGHPVLGLANALLLGLIGWGLVLLVQALLLQPISIVRYHRAADRLRRTLRSTSGANAMHHSWADAAPGAITVAADGRLWLADRSTDYLPVTLRPESIVHAEAISITTTAKGRSAPAVGIGLPMGGGLIATLSIGGGRASRVRMRHAVVLHYRVGPDAPVRVTTIAFGADLAGAAAMAAVLGRKAA